MTIADLCRRSYTLRSLSAIAVFGFGVTALGLFGLSIAFAGPIEDAWEGYRAGIAGNDRLSIELLTQAIESGKLPPKALLAASINRGASLIKLSRFQEAIADYDRVLKAEPNNSIALANKALALAKWGQYDKAVALFTSALAIDPDNAKTLLERGNAYFDEENYKEAIADYDNALKLSPDLLQAKNGRLEASRLIQHPDQSCECTPANVQQTESEGSNR